MILVGGFRKDKEQSSIEAPAMPVEVTFCIAVKDEVSPGFLIDPLIFGTPCGPIHGEAQL